MDNLTTPFNRTIFINPLSDPGHEMRTNRSVGRPTSDKPPDTFGQFLRNDRKVLCFSGYWDDRESMFGDLRHLELYYFLADDTVQIKELYERNSGRDGPSTFLARAKLPKTYDGSKLPTKFERRPALDVEYYSDKDLSIGSVVNVFGRSMHLIDCDQFTREYYRTTYGLEDFTPLPKPLRSLGTAAAVVVEDDDNSTAPQERTPDFIKFLKYDGIRLRFGAKLRSKISDNLDRLFIVTFDMANDEIAVYELAARNSGFSGGAFFRSQPFRMPQSNQPYQAHHFYIGAEIELCSFKFALVTADEFALKYMEAHPDVFRLSNVEVILEKVRTALRPKYKEFVARYVECLCEERNDSGQMVTVASSETIR